MVERPAHQSSFGMRHSLDGERINLEVQVATLQQKIAETFLAKLGESKDMEAERIDQLRILLADSEKLKADDLVKVFSQPAGSDLK
jgi:hypothetical protein